MPTITSQKPEVSARITSPRDRLPVALWAAAVILTATAAWLRPQALPAAATATAGPFATLAAIIAASALAGRLGLFRAAARLLIPGAAPRAVAAACVLVFTALLSGLVNLDVAVVVASFLLPTSNITSLLLLGRAPLPALRYLQGSWLAWLLVVAVTAGPLAGWLARAGTTPARPAAADARPSGRAALDLIPLFAAATAIRAILAAGIAPRGGLAVQVAVGSALACAVNNLPAAAALHPAGTAGLWAAILATAIGPGLLLTGSVATLICRRIARDAGAALSAVQFTAVGTVLVPVQLAAAVAGLHLTGTLS